MIENRRRTYKDRKMRVYISFSEIFQGSNFIPQILVILLKFTRTFQVRQVSEICLYMYGSGYSSGSYASKKTCAKN